MIWLVLVVLVGGVLLALALEREARPLEPVRLKPKPWPEMCWPTPEEWLDWLLSHRRDAQLVIAGRALDNAHRAHICLVMDHESAMEYFTSQGAPR